MAQSVNSRSVPLDPSHLLINALKRLRMPADYLYNQSEINEIFDTLINLVELAPTDGEYIPSESTAYYNVVDRYRALVHRRDTYERENGIMPASDPLLQAKLSAQIIGIQLELATVVSQVCGWDGSVSYEEIKSVAHAFLEIDQKLDEVTQGRIFDS